MSEYVIHGKLLLMNKRWVQILRELDRKQIYQLLSLGSILLIAIFLRIYKLGEWSFWGDEYITVRRALDILESPVIFQSPSILFTHIILKSFGVNEWYARIPAVIIGTITVPLFFWLVKRLVDTYVAIIASLLLAIAPWHVYWSQNARFYTALLLFYTLALFLFYLAIEEDRPWYFILSSIFLGLALYERLLAAFLIPTVVSYLILLKPGRFEIPRGLSRRNLLLFFVPVFVFLALFVLGNPTVQDSEQASRSFGFSNTNPAWILLGVVFYLGVPLICVSFFGSLGLLLRRNRLGLFLSLGAVVPLISIMLVSLGQYAANRYIFVSLTSIIVLAAIAVKELFGRVSKDGILFAIGISVVLFVAPMSDNVLYFEYRNGNRDNWKGAFDLISARIQENDQVITANRALADYYLDMETLGMQSIEVVGLDDILSSLNRTWIVIDVTAPGKGPSITHLARTKAEFIDRFDVNISARTFYMEVYLYDPSRIDDGGSTMSERP